MDNTKTPIELSVNKFFELTKNIKDYILPITIFAMVIGFNTVNNYLSEYGIPFPLDINLYALFLITTFYSLLLNGSLYLYITLPAFFIPKRFDQEFRKAIGISDDESILKRIYKYLGLIAVLPVTTLILIVDSNIYYIVISSLFITASLTLNFLTYKKCHRISNISPKTYFKNMFGVMIFAFFWFFFLVGVSGLILMKLTPNPDIFLVPILIYLLILHFLSIVKESQFRFKVFLMVVMVTMLVFSMRNLSGSFVGKYLLNELNMGGGKELRYVIDSTDLPSNILDEKNLSKELELLFSIKDNNYVKIKGDQDNTVYTIKDGIISMTIHKPKSH
ncbi:hypothetical protein [Marinicella meishanensis]|uniref:hypothetical protein n=1 Tax=Marinicella meishanensis TaxID=2873263 RepID=UPI001CBBC002|nr:hypothetical protein [Marinicella sp. NBU2979]